MKKVLITATALLLSNTGFAANQLMWSSNTLSEQKNEYCYYDVEVPFVTAKPGADQAVVTAITQVNADFKKIGNDVVSDYKININSDAQMCSELMWAYQKSLNFELTTKFSSEVVGVLWSIDSYTGGAHGIYWQFSYIFNANTGEKYESLASFVKPDKLEELKQLIENHLTENDDEDQQFDLEFGWNQWKSDTTSLDQVVQFYPTNQGIVVFFNVYEITPYAAGPVDVTLYWYELGDLLLENGPIQAPY